MNRRVLIRSGLWAAVAFGIAALALGPSFGKLKSAAERTTGGDLSFAALNGGRWSLASHRGQVVLVNFWATWCPPCRMETPDLVETYRKLAGRGFTVVGVTMDENPAEQVPPFVRRYGIPYPIVLPSDAVASKISALPTSILVDRSGRVARTYAGMVSQSVLEHDVSTLLQEPL